MKTKIDQTKSPNIPELTLRLGFIDLVGVATACRWIASNTFEIAEGVRAT
jgi:hypothetical protein